MNFVNSHKKIGSIFTVILSLLCFSAFMSAAASAQEDPYTCNTGLLQYSDGQLHQLDPISGLFSAVDVAADVDAMGYDTLTGLIYGLDEAENLVSINPSTGTTTTLGAVVSSSGNGNTLSDEFANVGQFNRFKVGDVSGGKLYAIPGGDTKEPIYSDGSGSLSYIERDAYKDVFEIDLASQTYIKHDIDYPGNDISPDVNIVFFDGDLVYHEGKLYSVNGDQEHRGGRVITVDLSTNTADFAVIDGLPMHMEHGAQWLAYSESGQLNLYAYTNDNGYTFEVSNFTGDSPAAKAVAFSNSLYSNDGAGCPDQVVSSFAVDAVDDLAFALAGQELAIDWLANDSATGEITMQSFDATSVNGVTISLNDDNQFVYLASGQSLLSTDSFSYTVCYNYAYLTSPYGLCDTATVSVELATPAVNIAATGPSSFTAGSEVEVVLTVANEGSGPALNGFLELVLPEGMAITNPAWQCEVGVCTYSMGNVEPSSIQSIAVTVQTEQSASSSEILATFSAENHSNVVSSFELDPENGLTVVLGASDVAGDDSAITSGTVVLAETGVQAYASVIAGTVLMVSAFGLATIAKRKSRLYFR